MEFNLSKDISEQLLEGLFFELLLHENSSRIWMENYRRCLTHWLKDYTQPRLTDYHSPLTKTLEGQN